MEIKSLLNIANLLMFIIINTGCEKEPFVITLEATSITNTGAVLRASTVPSSNDLYLEFEYGETHDYGEKIEGLGLAGPGGGGIISHEICCLLSGQTYYFRALLKSTKVGAKVIYGDELKFTTTVKDLNGNYYSIVTIGTQTWMKENLKVTILNDGTTIPVIIDAKRWPGLTTPGCCWYNNNTYYRDTYGALYNWQAVYEGVCPAGWHVPSVEELGVLQSFLGENAGGAMKEAGTLHWNSPNTGATNSSGFTGVAGGKRNSNGNYNELGIYGNWWSCSYEEDEFYENWVYKRHQTKGVFISSFTLYFESTTVGFSWFDSSEGKSVRCVRD